MSGPRVPIPIIVSDINDLYLEGVRYIRKARVRVRAGHEVGDNIQILNIPCAGFDPDR